MMKRLAVTTTCTLAVFASSSASAATIEWTSDWMKTAGFYGAGPPPAGVVTEKEAFGAASTMDQQETDLDKMPGVGKTELGITRQAAFTTRKVGAIYERNFKLTEDAEVTVTATLNGLFKFSGGPFIEMDFLNARAVAEVKDTSIRAIAFKQLGFRELNQLLQEGKDQFPVNDKKTETGELKTGDYTFKFTFDSDVQLDGGAPGSARLEALLFDTYTADIKVVPEPTSNLGFLALGTLGAASTLKRKLKPSQSIEKETTKVS